MHLRMDRIYLQMPIEWFHRSRIYAKHELSCEWRDRTTLVVVRTRHLSSIFCHQGQQQVHVDVEARG